MKTINTTLEVAPEHVNLLEDSLRAKFKVIDYKILPDTNKMYEEDETFQKIVKGIRKANLVKDRYINEHNQKYATH